MTTWAEEVARGKFEPGFCQLCNSEGARCDHPGNGTLYDTAKFCGGLWGEEKRIDTLKSLGMLDTPREKLFDKVTEFLMSIFDTQCSHLVLIDPNRCWFKSWQGKWKEFETDTDHGRNVECPREEGWCNYILVPTFAEILIIEDATKDARLALNPFVVGPPHFRFYAGAPLVGSRGERYGTLCVADFTPRQFEAEQYALLTNFAHLVVEELERDKPTVEILNKTTANYVERSRHLDLSIKAATDGVCMVDMRDSQWPIMFANEKFWEALGQPHDFRGNFWDLCKTSTTTDLQFSLATGLGDTFEMDVQVQHKGLDLHVQLLPATSDRLAPSKCTAIPGWIPSQEFDPFSQSVQSRISVDKSGTEIVQDCKCFWFVIICANVPLTSRILATAERKGGYSAGGAGGAEVERTGDEIKRRPSQQSSTTAASGRAFSILGSSWTSFWGDYPLPPKLRDKVELGPLLGSGSFGKAYRATMAKEEACAVKVVDCRKREDHVIQEQLREVQLSASMSHEKVVKILDYDTSSGFTKGRQLDILWIVQELCDMGDLVSATERGFLRVERKITSPPDLKVCRSVLSDIAEGMAFIHSCNIIHADLTGRNVLLSSNSSEVGFGAKVADFGLARYSVGSKGLPVKDIGTVTHMPPELMDPDGGNLIPQADVWAFGILAWEAYHGKACYKGKNAAQIVVAIFRGQTPQWSEDAGDLGVLMKKCISYSPDDRPTFSAALESLRSLTID